MSPYPLPPHPLHPYLVKVGIQLNLIELYQFTPLSARRFGYVCFWMNYIVQSIMVKLVCESAKTGNYLVLGKIFHVWGPWGNPCWTTQPTSVLYIAQFNSLVSLAQYLNFECWKSFSDITFAVNVVFFFFNKANKVGFLWFLEMLKQYESQVLQLCWTLLLVSLMKFSKQDQLVISLKHQQVYW